jgi:hypothetical protein
MRTMWYTKKYYSNTFAIIIVVVKMLIGIHGIEYYMNNCTIIF